jgi:hypothetical protein
MNFFDIVMAICLMSDPSSCKEQHLQFESYKSLNECVFDAQFYIASWQTENPGWTIKNWRCEYAQEPEGEESPS